jgi:hypothetical protein
LQTAGIYDNRDQLQESFFKSPRYVQAEGNAGISASEATIKVPKREIDMDAVDKLLTKQANVTIQGLLATELTDMDKLRGFGRLIGAWGAGTEEAKEFVKMSTERQVDMLSKYIINGYRADIMRDNNIRFDKENNAYYQLDEMALKEFDTKKSGGGSAIDPDLEAIKQQMLKAEPRKHADYPSYKSRKVSWDGKMFTITTEGSKGKDKPFNSVEDAIAYMAGLPTKK